MSERVVKEPVWIWSVPAYFYAGGAAGAAAVLGAAAQVSGRRDLRRLVGRCRWIALSGSLAGTMLLILDLGRPRRFLNMLRVVRPTSPLSVGSWLLAMLSGATGASVALRGATADAAGLAAGVLGLPFSGYTAVLLANTAIPEWSSRARDLPWCFVASSAVGAASLLDLLPASAAEDAVVRRFGALARAADLVVARPRSAGEQAGRALVAASLVATVLPRRRLTRVAAGALGTAASVCTRFAVFGAGFTTAGAPRDLPLRSPLTAPPVPTRSS